jgi:hypothetical protein
MPMSPVTVIIGYGITGQKSPHDRRQGDFTRSDQKVNRLGIKAQA